ncbi:hypothetical protein EDC96DRAFT_550110 [Choanephora cucurbitarum]|nr:hypothetical protein EDC96DRAFT_550110 [Choanephora cucurbitarum]
MLKLYQILGINDERMIKRTFLKAICPNIALEVKRGDVVEDTKLKDVIAKAIKAEKFSGNIKQSFLLLLPTYQVKTHKEVSIRLIKTGVLKEKMCEEIKQIL